MWTLHQDFGVPCPWSLGYYHEIFKMFKKLQKCLFHDPNNCIDVRCRQSITSFYQDQRNVKAKPSFGIRLQLIFLLYYVPKCRAFLLCYIDCTQFSLFKALLQPQIWQVCSNYYAIKSPFSTPSHIQFFLPTLWIHSCTGSNCHFFALHHLSSSGYCFCKPMLATLSSF